MVQTLLRSSHTGWGLASLASDAEDLGLLARYLRSALGSQVRRLADAAWPALEGRRGQGADEGRALRCWCLPGCLPGKSCRTSAAAPPLLPFILRPHCCSCTFPLACPACLQGIALLGHSTGCQDIVRFLGAHGRGAAGMPPVVAAILEVRWALPYLFGRMWNRSSVEAAHAAAARCCWEAACVGSSGRCPPRERLRRSRMPVPHRALQPLTQAPASDREFLATDDDTPGRLKEARRMVKRGDAEEVRRRGAGGAAGAGSCGVAKLGAGGGSM